MRVGLMILGAAVCLAAPLPGALAQPPPPQPIVPTHRFSWEENCGWMNWAGGGAAGVEPTVLVAPTYLSGMIWCENIGWVNVGGIPGDGYHYGDTTDADFGVNRDSATGALSGFAWGENTGWINFGGGALATPPNGARFDAAAHRLRGYAWGENVGWVNLDDAVSYVAVACKADCDSDGVIGAADVACFVNSWFASLGDGTLGGDFDKNGIVQPADIAVFVNAWFAALRGGC